MLNRFYFALLLLYKHKKEHSSVFIISTFLVFLVSSVLFLSSSMKRDLFATLESQADITVQKYIGGRVVNLPEQWVDEFLELPGVSSASARVYGEYYYETKERHFFIVGIDFFDENALKLLDDLGIKIDIDKFLERDSMIIGSGVKEFFDTFEYKKYYIFRNPQREKRKVYIYDSLPSEGDLVGSDLILMEKDVAKEILGIDAESVSDIVLNIANKDELQTIENKLAISHFDTRIITKQDIKNNYTNLFNYKGGVFLSLYVVVIVTFLLVLFQRYLSISENGVKEVAILRSIGWTIERIIAMKLIQNGVIIVWAYLLGVILAYFYVFVFGAPLLKQIFLGGANLQNMTSFTPYITFSDLFLIFLFFVVPFLLSIIIPLWKLSVSEPSEVLR